MHRDVALNIPHARDGKLYLESGRHVLLVWSDLSQEEDAKVSGLRSELAKLVGGLHGYDSIVLHLREEAAP